MSQGAWQDWDDVDYIDYLERYYGMQFTNAQKILKSAMMEESEALLIAVFNKIASPSVYLQPHFKKHMIDKNKTNPPIHERQPTPTTNVPERRSMPDKDEGRWKLTKTKGTLWMSERDASEEEVMRAMDPNSKDTWYMPPKDGYQFGAVFKKVKA